MIYSSKDMESRAVLDTAAKICAAARTAPKTRGMDGLVTCVLTGEDKSQLARSRCGSWPTSWIMRSLTVTQITLTRPTLWCFSEWRRCGAGLTRAVSTVTSKAAPTVQKRTACARGMPSISASPRLRAAAAADARVDSRVMVLRWRSAKTSGLLGEKASLVLGLPLSISGKSPVPSDRKPKK